MKQYILILAVLVTGLACAQKPIVDATHYKFKTTTQRDALAIPANTTPILWNSDNNRFETYNGTSWVAFASGGGGSQNLQQVTDLGATTTNDLTIEGDANSGFYLRNVNQGQILSLKSDSMEFLKNNNRLTIQSPNNLGDYTLMYPQLTANDTIALKSELSVLGLQNIIDDTTPQLGGNLDVNGNRINSNGTLDFYIDADNNGTDSRFRVFSNIGTNLFEIKEDGTLFAPSMSDAKIVTQGNSALITKGYADSNYMGGSSIEGITTTGTLAGGDLVIEIGDPNDIDTSNVLKIDVGNNTVHFENADDILMDGVLEAFSILTPELQLANENNSFLATFSSNGLTSNIVCEVPSISGKLALEADPSGFDGNLSNTDATLQQIAQKFDDYVGGGSGHTIENNGTPLTSRASLNFGNGLLAEDNVGNNSTDISLDTSDLFTTYTDSPIKPKFWGGTDAQHTAKFGVDYVHPDNDFVVITDGTPPVTTASDIVNTPSGNLVATDVQGALDELQTELDGVDLAGYGQLGANNTWTRTQTLNSYLNFNNIISNNSGLGQGISSNNIGSGVGIYSETTNGDGISSRGTAGGTGYIYTGGIDGVGNTFTVTKEGDVVANSFVGDGSGLTNLPSGGGSLPAGGITGQVLAKASATDNDVEWVSTTAATITDFDTEVSNNASVVANTAKVSEDKFEVIQLACSDLTTDITTGTSKAYFRMPYAATLVDVRASVLTAPTGSTFIVDINESGTTLMTTNKLSIDATEKTSTTATTSHTLTDTSLADDAEITIDIDQIGSTVAGAGLIITLELTRI